ncbi:hypothetical protein cypCar_00010806 [Cyprinus carpio]|nr:hypothetical protein cypCar_00010806 [Cyprinus carpio]
MRPIITLKLSWLIDARLYSQEPAADHVSDEAPLSKEMQTVRNGWNYCGISRLQCGSKKSLNLLTVRAMKEQWYGSCQTVLMALDKERLELLWYLTLAMWFKEEFESADLNSLIAGTYCEQKRLLCDLNPCWNDSRCEETANEYVCTCPGGFTGLNCETTTEADSYRKSNRCQLDEACATDKLPFILPCLAVLFAIPLRDTILCIPRCLCGHGYTGVHCELDIDFCSGHQCSEHAVCLDQQHNYTSHCMLGYEGTFCELQTDECKSIALIW